MDAADDLAEVAKTFTAEVQATVAEFVGRGKTIVEAARTTIGSAVDEGQQAADAQRASMSSQQHD